MNSTKIALMAFLCIFSFVNATTPVISSVLASSIANESATISWTTNFPTIDNWVVFYVSGGNSFQQFASANDTAHSVNLVSLIPNTLYYFNVTSCDGADECATSEVYTFTTLPNPTISIPAPQITDVSISANATNESVVITYLTDIDSDSAVFYGTASGSYPLNVVLSNSVMSHSLTIANLVNSTSYYYIVRSCNASNCTNSSEKSFSTLANPIPTATPTPTPSTTPSPTPTPTPTPTSSAITPPTTICYDSDGGKNYYSKGSIISANENGDDVCETATVLKEYLCSDDKTQGGTLRYGCPYGCSLGRCQEKGEKESGISPTSTPTPTLQANEAKIGFRTKVLGIFDKEKTTFTLKQQIFEKFDGELHFNLPFEFKDYTAGLISFTPKPLFVKSDDFGKIEAIWELAANKDDELTFKIDISKAIPKSKLDEFSSPIMLNSLEGAPELLKTNADENSQSNGTNESVNALTGLASGGAQASSDSGWFIPVTMFGILVVGVGLIYFHEKDLHHLHIEDTSSILDELNSESAKVAVIKKKSA
ncbi:fibronectin type III domain-containing protein [Candidatus Micrarchaeota archaeon]|nr:fibronectin type III domain-containing protein [Candidatus Micrarchaeota archaeon]